MALPATTQRVTLNTRDEVNQRIARETAQRVRWYARHPERIDERLAELDREWDIERILEANAASVSLVGLGLGVFVHRRFLLVPAAVGGFLLLHALQGWCPPVPFLRSRGVRTQTEIEGERCSLLALRRERDARPAPARAARS